MTRLDRAGLFFDDEIATVPVLNRVARRWLLSCPRRDVVPCLSDGTPWESKRPALSRCSVENSPRSSSGLPLFIGLTLGTMLVAGVIVSS